MPNEVLSWTSATDVEVIRVARLASTETDRRRHAGELVARRLARR